MKETEIKKNVRKSYASVAKQSTSCCAPTTSCCSNQSEAISKAIGYSEHEISSVPEGANLGLGCGNPVALASLKEGETVLDLGSGAGFDCFLAAQRVGEKGKVIGVDMTPEMVDKARENALEGNSHNVEFRLGEIENLPVADNSADIVISNCVINLSPDKPRVFKEAFRVLKPGGRLMVSDIVLLKELPTFIINSVSAYVGCISGAMLKDEYLATIKSAGFNDVKILEENVFPIDCMANDPTAQAIIKELKMPEDKIMDFANSVLSVRVQAKKVRH
jgi:SAM-dependent methyltransferase